MNFIKIKNQFINTETIKRFTVDCNKEYAGSNFWDYHDGMRITECFLTLIYNNGTEEEFVFEDTEEDTDAFLDTLKSLVGEEDANKTWSYLKQTRKYRNRPEDEEYI